MAAKVRKFSRNAKEKDFLLTLNGLGVALLVKNIVRFWFVDGVKEKNNCTEIANNRGLCIKKLRKVQKNM
ncbi:MAG: hypothetical protein IJV34_06025 [Prevotella sp.]|nr:hypothetical protein [Prevotella sp.]